MTNFSTEPITIELPVSKGKVTLRPFKTKRMERAATAVFLRYSKLNLNSEKTEDIIEINDLPAIAAQEIVEVTIRNIVLSVNDTAGDADAVVDACYDLCEEDFSFVEEKCNEILKTTAFSPKKEQP